MKNILIKLTILLSITILYGCKEKREYKSIGNENNIINTEVIHEIVVKENIKASTYDYLNVEEDGKTYWMAIPNFSVEVGKTYFYKNAMIMKNFVSEKLGKTFDEIIFSEGIFESKDLLNEALKPAMSVNMDHVKKENKSEIKEVKLPKIKNSITIEDIFSKPKSYANNSILVYGVVIKVNNGIMDKNWIHIADGTNFNDKSDLTITTMEHVNVGDTLKFNGKLILDKDFGHGYIYDVLLEDGKVVK